MLKCGDFFHSRHFSHNCHSSLSEPRQISFSSGHLPREWGPHSRTPAFLHSAPEEFEDSLGEELVGITNLAGF